MTEQSESRLLEAVARLLEAEARMQAEVVHEWLLDLNELLYGTAYLPPAPGCEKVGLAAVIDDAGTWV
jgi:hypothetical protein